jgi:hypothetical protein
MRDGEVRRVWLEDPEHDEPLVYEVTLASVLKTDAAGALVLP